MHQLSGKFSDREDRDQRRRRDRENGAEKTRDLSRKEENLIKDHCSIRKRGANLIRKKTAETQSVIGSSPFPGQRTQKTLGMK